MQQHPEILVCGGNVDPLDDVDNCKRAIRAASWWKRSEMQEHWPLSTDEAAQMLFQAGEFEIDADGLVELIGRKLLPSPGIGEDNELEWDPSDVLRVGGLLEMRGQWRATPSGHDPKKHPCQLTLELARGAGEVESIVTTPNGIRYDVRHLLAWLVQIETHEARAKIAALLKVVLEVEHGIIT